MAGKALKSSGKQVIKYSRDGAVERNLAENSEKRISDRTEDAVLKVEHTDEKLTVRGERTEQPTQEESHKRHKPHYEPEQQTVAENTQPSALQFEDKTFKFDDTVNPAPAANNMAAGVPPTPENTAEEQQAETPEETTAAQQATDRRDIPNEAPQDNSIIENLFAEFYGRDNATDDSAKPSGKFEFKKSEQPASDTDKKRKSSRLQEETKTDSKLKTETESTSLKQDTEKSSLAFVSAVAVDGDAADSAEKTKSKRRIALKDKREDALSEESENADTLKFEHTDRSLEKQSHFADRLSDGSAASKKLKANKGVVEEVSPEDAKRQDVRKQQRKAQQAEIAKMKAGASVEPLTDDEVTGAVRRAKQTA